MRLTATRTLRGCAALLLSAAALAAGGGTALAEELAEFEILEFSGNNGLTLDDRIGSATTADTERRYINIEDCDAYAGGTFNVEIRYEPDTDYDRTVGAHYSQVGSSCSDIDANPTGDDGCFNASEELSDDGINERVELNVEVDFLTGGDCSSGETGTAQIYFVVEYSGTDINGNAVDTSDATTIDIQVDLAAPAAPTITEVSAGDQRLVVTFEDNGNDTQGDVDYVIYWSDEPITSANKANAAKETSSTADSVAIESDALENGTLYYVRVEAIDEADNESSLSPEFEAIPLSTTDFWEHYLAAGGTEKGGHCFVATAAWGTPMAAELDALRSFRDGVLMPTAGGAVFVDWYYRWGRFAAAAIADRPVLRAVTRVALTPLVWFAHLANLVGGLAALLLVLAGLVLVSTGLVGTAALVRRMRGTRQEVVA